MGNQKAWTNQQTFPSDNPRPVQNAYLNHRYSQNLYTNSCWHCGIAGYISRNCPMKTQGTTYSQLPSSFINRGSKNKDQANVYIRMTLYDKGIPCLVDSGCETTLVPKTLIDSFGDVEVWSTTKQVWAANNTEIRIYGEAYLPFVQSMWKDHGRSVKRRRRVKQ